MRKVFLVTALALTAASPVNAAEFQPMGTLGIGGAGVARTYDAHAPYWNPAGLAFSTTGFSSRIDASVGMKVNNGLADNIDRLGDLDFDTFNTINTSAADPQVVADTVQAITLLNDIQAKNGTIAVNGNAVLSFQIKRFGFGAFGTIEGFAQPKPDMINILPEANNSSTAVTPAQFAAQAGAAPASSLFFSATQRAEISAALTANGFTASEALNVINSTDSRLASSGLSSQEVASALVNNIAPAFGPGGGTRVLDNNTTAVITRSLAYLEFPLSYGHPFDLGPFGTIGIGATAKVIAGRVYQSQTFLLKSGTTVSSSDITKDLTRNYKDSTNFGIDVGALWRYNKWLNVGVVAKNLNAPDFDAPELKDKSGATIANSGGTVKLDPQVRLGVSLDPVDWLTLAADVDLTENDSVVAADYFKNRHVGGGFEWHYFSWFKFRGGMYSNLADKGIGPTATAGLTLGPTWFNFDIDGAYGLETARYKEKNYPQEARVQFQLNFLF